jgi:hypothetical protein
MHPVRAIFSGLIISWFLTWGSTELFNIKQQDEPWVFASFFLGVMLLNLLTLLIDDSFENQNNKEAIKKIEKERQKLIDSL